MILFYAVESPKIQMGTTTCWCSNMLHVEIYIITYQKQKITSIYCISWG